MTPVDQLDDAELQRQLEDMAERRGRAGAGFTSEYTERDVKRYHELVIETKRRTPNEPD